MKNLVFNLYAGPPLSGKSEFLMEKMAELHKVRPFDYLFVGPSGRFVKEVADKFARLVDTTIPRGNFFVIDQLAVHLYRVLHPEQLHIHEELLSVFVADIISKLPEEELGNLSRVRTSPELIRFTIEAVREAKEEGVEEFLKTLESNPGSARLVSRVLVELEKRYGGRLFDSFDAYVNADPGKLKLSEYVRQRFGAYLFLDGFTSFSPVHMIFLSRLFPIFDEIHMTMDTVIWDARRWRSFEDMLNKYCAEMGRPLILKKRLFDSDSTKSRILKNFLNDQPATTKPDFIEIYIYKNPDEELKGISSMIKRMIVDQNVQPSEIAIVLNNFIERARDFQKKLEEYGVPVRLEGDEPLINSRAVQLVILPFKTAAYGYPPEMLMSMLDQGVGKPSAFWYEGTERQIDVEELERLATAAALYIEPPRSSLKQRFDSWFEKLEALKQSLLKKQELLNSEDEFSDALEEVQIELLECKYLIERLGELFGFLKPLESTRTRKTDMEFYLSTLRSWIDMTLRKIDSSEQQKEELISEVFALQRFKQVLDTLEVTFKAAAVERVTLDEFMTFLQTALQTESYKPSPDFSNRVEILTLENARFRQVQYKIFVDFIDGIYPSVRHNPLYPLQETHSSYQYYRKKAREQEENFYTSLKSCEKAVLAIPVATREGEPLTPSFWLRRLFPDAVNTASQMESEREEILYPMSRKELETHFNWALAQGKKVAFAEGQEFNEPSYEFPMIEVEPFDYRVKRVDVLKDILPKVISYTRIHDYRECPFKFFLKYVMGLREPWDETYDLSPLELGSIYHRALKSIYEWAEESGKKLELPLQEKRVRAIVEKLLDEFVSEHRIRGHVIVRNYLREKITSVILDYLKVESESPKSYIGSSTLTERPFRIPLKTLEEWLPKTAEKYGEIEIVGRIDRIDIFDELVATDHAPVVVSDYKRSGNSTSWEQLELYVIALLSLMDSENIPYAEKVQALYRIVEDRGKTRFSKQLRFSAEDGVFERINAKGKEGKTRELMEIDRELLEILNGIFEDAFFPKDKKCWNCRFKEVCGSTQWRVEIETAMGRVHREE